MSELTKTDEKLLALIAPFLKDIQAFVDKNIQGKNTLTAAGIGEKFTAENPKCKLSNDVFVKAFRVAVHAEKITGIESAKRAGYRRIGATADEPATDADTVSSPSIEPYLEDLQAFVDLYIQGAERMTAAAIYQKFSAENKCALSEDEFVVAFRLAIKENKITGLESAYRWGYRRAGAQMFDENEEDETDSCSIIIDSRRRVTAQDRYNWAYQVRNSSGKWVTEGYYSSAPGILRSLARKLMDDELKSMESFNVAQLEEKFGEAQTHLADLLKAAMNKIKVPDVSNEEPVADAE